MKIDSPKNWSRLTIISVVTTPAVIVLGLLMAFVLTNFESVNIATREYPQIARWVVFFFAGSIAVGVLAGIVELFRKEEPRWLPVAGLVFTLLALIAFHFTAAD